MAHSGTDSAGDELLEPEHDDSALFPFPPPLLLPFLLDGRELTEWSTSPQLAILKKYCGKGTVGIYGYNGHVRIYLYLLQ